MTVPKTGHTFAPPLDPAHVDQRRRALLDTVDEVVAAGPFDGTWPSLQQWQPPRWYVEAKFGIFVHWLACSVAGYGDDWYARKIYLAQTDEHARHTAEHGPLTDHGFKDVLPRFTGEHFDADDWIGLVQRAGARFVVPVAEHHDGFSLYDNALSRWKAPLVGPRRDVIGELVAAARDAGVHVGLSSHRAENWWFFHGARQLPSDAADEQWADLYGPRQPRSSQPDPAFLDDWLARTAQLVLDHDPELVWFDWWIEQPAFEPYRRRFAAFLYNHAAARGHEAVINYKWDAFAEGSAVLDVERGALRTTSARYFQNDTSTSRRAWTYLEDNDFKSVAEIVTDLVDVVSKNGALLLNIGPLPDGTIDPRERLLLEGVGDWLTVNGDAIFETRPWVVFGEGPTRSPAGSFVDTAPVPWTGADLRFTARGDDVYVTVLGPVADGRVTVRTLSPSLRVADVDVSAVTALGHTGPLPWTLGADGLVVDVGELPIGNGLPFVLRIHAPTVPPPVRDEPPILD